MNQRREPKPTSLLQFVKIPNCAFSKVEYYFQKDTKKECWIWDNVLSAQGVSKMSLSPRMGVLQWQWKNQFRPWFEWTFWPWFYLFSQWSSFFFSLSPFQLTKFFFWHFFCLNVSGEGSLSVWGLGRKQDRHRTIYSTRINLCWNLDFCTNEGIVFLSSLIFLIWNFHFKYRGAIMIWDFPLCNQTSC